MTLKLRQQSQLELHLQPSGCHTGSRPELGGKRQVFGDVVEAEERPGSMTGQEGRLRGGFWVSRCVRGKKVTVLFS